MSGKTSVIIRPPSAKFVMRWEWALRAIRLSVEQGKKRGEVVECGAEVLSVLEYHRNYALENRLFKTMLQKATNKQVLLIDTNGFLPYSISYLEECLFQGRGKDVITKALIVLEEMKFVSSNVPQKVVEHYASGVMKWYRLETDFINDWIQRIYNFVPSPIVNVEVETPKPKPVTVTKQEDITLNYIGSFYRHIHNKSNKFVFGKERRVKVMDRLKEGRTLAQVAQAIIGNLFSEYHQGKNPDNKIYDDIEMICSDEVRFEKHLAYAERGGVTEAIANEQFQLFLKGQISRYSKVAGKTSQTGSNEQIEGIPKLSPAEFERYNSFSLDIAPFLNSQTPLAEIFQLIRGNQSLNEKGKGLNNSEILNKTLLESLKVFNNNPSQEIFDLLKRFADNFADFQKVNK